MQGQWSFSITQGGGWTRVLTFAGDYDFVGATALMTMTPASGTTVTLSTANGKITIDSGAKTVTLTLTAPEVSAIDWMGVTNSDLTIFPADPNGEVIRLVGIASLN